jgi:hypothetical protein
VIRLFLLDVLGVVGICSALLAVYAHAGQADPVIGFFAVGGAVLGTIGAAFGRFTRNGRDALGLYPERKRGAARVYAVWMERWYWATFVPGFVVAWFTHTPSSMAFGWMLCSLAVYLAAVLVERSSRNGFAS